VKVKDLMTKDVLTVSPEASLKEVATILTDAGISGVPVTGPQGEVLGVVSEADIVRKERGADPRPKGVLGWFLVEPPELQRKLAARTAGEAMSAPATTIEPWKPVQEAARLMSGYAINRLPVVDEHGILVGIVTRNDIVRAFIRSDAEILSEIEDDVIQNTLWISPGRVSVTVSQGEVTLTGQVETELDAELLPAFVERVPGVVGVTAKLTAEREGKREGTGSKVGR
jgi:CBS-domain-containing membrane protein